MVWDEISLLSGTAKPPGKQPFQTLLALPLKKLLLPHWGGGIADLVALRASSHPPGLQLLPIGQESCLPLAPFQHSRVFLLKGLWSVNKIECRTAPLFAPWVGELLAATSLQAAAASTGRWLEGAGGGDHRWSGSTFSSHSGFATDFPGTSLPLSGLHVVNEG